jgi:hypothetical protein
MRAWWQWFVCKVFCLHSVLSAQCFVCTVVCLHSVLSARWPSAESHPFTYPYVLNVLTGWSKQTTKQTNTHPPNKQTSTK